MNHIQVSRGLKAVVLMAVLGLAVAGLSQCRMVEDNVTGLDLKSNATVSARSKCIKVCNNENKALKKAEDARHKAADKACKADPDKDRSKACKKSEKDRHDDNKDALKDALETCKRGCYNEGNGNGGR